MHMILYYGQEMGMWLEELKVTQSNKQGQPLPVQLWSAIWDSRFVSSSYVHFEEHFFKILCIFFNHPCDHSLIDELKIFLRPKYFNGSTIVGHNWGNWYCYVNDTMIRVYGFENTPFLLSKIVSDRIAYLEIVRQLHYFSVMNLSSIEKQSFMPSTLCFGDFTILSKEGYDMILNKLS